MVLSLTRSLSALLFILCLFPYVSFVSTPFDTQPYAVVVAALVVVMTIFTQKNLQIPLLWTPIAIIFGYALIAFLLSFNLTGLRSLVGYASVFLLSLAGYWTFNRVKGKDFIFAVWTWLIVGILQTFINRGFGTFLLARARTSETRGVTSLAVEPSYYAIICIFFLILNDIFLARGDYQKKTYKTIFLLITVQLILSRAGLGFVFFFVYLVGKMLSQMNVVKIFKWSVLIAGVGAIVYLMFTNIASLQATRIGRLFFLLSLGPEAVLLRDGSAADRFSHMVVSFLSLPYNYGLGFGFGVWDLKAAELTSEIGGFISRVAAVNMTYGNRIMSGWGSTIFELGLMGVFFIVSFIHLMRKGFKKVDREMKKVYISSGISIFFIMLMAVPIAFPLFGYLIGVFIRIQNTPKEG